MRLSSLPSAAVFCHEARLNLEISLSPEWTGLHEPCFLPSTQFMICPGVGAKAKRTWLASTCRWNSAFALARRFLSTEGTRGHDWLLLVPKGHQYLKFLSDLAGFDPKTYDGSVGDILSKAMSWLATRTDTVTAPTPRQVLAALPDFLAAKKRLVKDWGDDVPWADIVLAAIDCAPTP